MKPSVNSHVSGVGCSQAVRKTKKKSSEQFLHATQTMSGPQEAEGKKCGRASLVKKKRKKKTTTPMCLQHAASGEAARGAHSVHAALHQGSPPPRKNRHVWLLASRCVGQTSRGEGR